MDRIVTEYKNAVRHGDEKGIVRAIARYRDAVPPELIDACTEEMRREREQLRDRKEGILSRIMCGIRDGIRDERDREIVESMEAGDGGYYSELRDRIVKIADKEELVKERVNAIKKVLKEDRPIEWVGMVVMPVITIVGIILEHVLTEITKDESETKTMKKTAQGALESIAANFRG